jgi:hypothetical protein
MENIVIISSMRKRIMSFTICMLFELFRRWYDMTTWEFNSLFMQQVIKYPITLSNVKCVALSCCWLLEAGFKLEHTNGLDLDPKLHSATHISACLSLDDSLLYSIVLMWRSFLGLSLLLWKLQDSLAQLSQSRAHCKTWLTLEKM